MTSPLVMLVVGVVGVWALSLFPAFRVGGIEQVIGSTVGALLALAPAAVILGWEELAPPDTPEGRLRRMALAMGLRMGFGLGVGMGLYFLVPVLHSTSFWIWVLVYYLIALTLETALLARSRLPAEAETASRETNPPGP